MKFGIIAAVVLLIALSAYLLWPRNYGYEAFIENDAVHVKFNRPIKLANIILSRVEKKRTNIEGGYEIHNKICETATAHVGGRKSLDGFTLNTPAAIFTNSNIEWEDKPLQLEPGKAYALGWNNTPAIFGFDMTTTGPVSW